MDTTWSCAYQSNSGRVTTKEPRPSSKEENHPPVISLSTTSIGSLHPGEGGDGLGPGLKPGSGSKSSLGNEFSLHILESFTLV